MNNYGLLPVLVPREETHSKTLFSCKDSEQFWCILSGFVLKFKLDYKRKIFSVSRKKSTHNIWGPTLLIVSMKANDGYAFSQRAVFQISKKLKLTLLVIYCCGRKLLRLQHFAPCVLSYLNSSESSHFTNILSMEAPLSRVCKHKKIIPVMLPGL